MQLETTTKYNNKQTFLKHYTMPSPPHSIHIAINTLFLTLRAYKEVWRQFRGEAVMHTEWDD